MKFIIAPTCSGKTTYVAAHPNAYDDDEAAPDGGPLSELLERLRRANDWPRHNRAWHFLLRSWRRSLPATAKAVTAHSLADAQAMAEPTGDEYAFVLLPRDEWERRIAQRDLDAEGIRIAELNRKTVEEEIQRHPEIPVLTTFPAGNPDIGNLTPGQPTRHDTGYSFVDPVTHAEIRVFRRTGESRDEAITRVRRHHGLT